MANIINNEFIEKKTNDNRTSNNDKSTSFRCESSAHDLPLRNLHSGRNFWHKLFVTLSAKV